MVHLYLSFYPPVNKIIKLDHEMQYLFCIKAVYKSERLENFSINSSKTDKFGVDSVTI